MKLPYLIAEVGVNFFDTARIENTSPLSAAKKYIRLAKQAGANAVKFQAYKAKTIVSKNSPAYWDLTKESTRTQFELFSKFDSLTKEDYTELAEECRKIGVDFMCTPFDYESADFLNDLCDIFKVSSSDLSNLEFLKYIAKKGKPIYLSVGASYLSEIEEAVRTIREVTNSEIALLHCVLSYPTKNNDANLAAICALKRHFPNFKVGYSDHTLPDENMQILSTAFLYGAEIIEKHFTLDKSLPGNDHYHAGDPNDFKKAIKNFQLIVNITGSDEITVLDCEKNSRLQARRSLVLARDKKAGEALTLSDLMAKRPGTGIPAKYQNLVLGKKLNKDLKEDTILQWDDLFNT